MEERKTVSMAETFERVEESEEAESAPKKKKKDKKKKKKSSSSSKSSSRSSSSSSDKKKKKKKKSRDSDDDFFQQAAAQADPAVVENLKVELRQAKEQWADEIDCLRAEYEELQRENEYYKRQEQAKLDEAEKAKSANLFDKFSETVKNAMYKTKFEDLERRYALQEQQFEKRMREI